MRRLGVTGELCPARHSLLAQGAHVHSLAPCRFDDLGEDVLQIGVVGGRPFGLLGGVDAGKTPAGLGQAEWDLGAGFIFGHYILVGFIFTSPRLHIGKDG